MHISSKISPPSSSDADLVSHFRSTGDDAAFSEIVRRHLPLVMAVTRRRLGNSGLAEDAAQQVFIALFRVLRKRTEMPCVAAWLQKAAVYESSNLARRETRHRRRVEYARDLWTSTEAPASDIRIDEALASLSDADRQILLLHHFEKLSFAAIATRLGKSEAAVQRRGHRALAKLAGILQSCGSRRNAGSCAAWLGASLSPPGTVVPSDFVARISAIKKSAVSVLPWLPIAAVVTLGGGIWTAVTLDRPQQVVPSATPVVEARPRRERPPARPFIPRIADDKLSEETREFISRAKADSGDAWEWVKQRPQGPIRFIEREAVRALADRDLPA
ncbi:MAG: sigma-70 family RNA polymerase sigma factor, partial [Verrucomicrobiaceae bacterium]